MQRWWPGAVLPPAAQGQETKAARPPADSPAVSISGVLNEKHTCCGVELILKSWQATFQVLCNSRAVTKGLRVTGFI